MRDLDEFFDPSLRLPIRGKTYVVESPDAKTGLRVQRLLTTGVVAAAGGEVSQEDLDSLELDDKAELDLYLGLLGSTYDEMVADGLPWEMIKHAGGTAMMWVAFGIEAAERFWEDGAPSGEASRPEPQDHKAPAASQPSRRAASRGTSTGQRKRTPTSPSPTS
jgi:hypothetical protein